MSPVLPPLRVTVAGVDYTDIAQNISWSNVDPGGCEVANFDIGIEAADKLNPGDIVRIHDGQMTSWVGRIAEPSKSIQHGFIHSHRRAQHIGEAVTRVACEGAGAVAKDNKMSMIYIDRDLSRWVGPSVSRQAAVIGVGYVLGSFQVGSDPTNLQPALAFSLPSPYAGIPLAEVWYDAGPGNLVQTLEVDGVLPVQMPASWSMQTFVSTDDTASSSELLHIFVAAGSGVDQAAPPRRWAMIQALAPNSTNTASITYLVTATPVVIGNHGLPIQSSPLGRGLLVSDIARDAALRCRAASGNAFRIGQVDTFSNYILQHYVQQGLIEHENVIADMAKLAPAHYGWWPSTDIFSDVPEFIFRAYDTSATAFCSLGDCNEADVSERLSEMWSSAIITYSDAAGTSFQIQVTLPNAELDRVGIARTTTFDLGVSSAAAAQVFANFALQALFAQARSGGSLVLPRTVRNANGAPMSSRKLRAGIDRIRIVDLPIRSALLTGTDTDSFRISRVQNTLDTTSGEVETRVEIDSGPNLIETLQARFSVATLLGGGGGSG